MKKFIATYIALILFVALGVYVYFFERKPIVSKEEQETQIFKFDKEKIEQIEIIKSQETIVCEKRAQWQLIKPKEVRTSNETFQTMIELLSDLKAERIIEKEPKDLAIYGLNNPEIKVNILLNKETKTLEIGMKNPTGSSYYIKDKNKMPVYLLEEYNVKKIDKDFKDYRDRKVVDIEIENVTKIEMNYQGKKLSFTKKKENIWQIDTPIFAKADSTKIKDFIQKLKDLYIDEFEEDQPTDLKKYGLTKPQITVKIWLGDVLKTILIGGKKDTEKIFVKREEESSIYVVRKGIIDDLNKKPEDLRAEKLIEFDKEKLTKIKVNEVIAEKKEKKWIIVKPKEEKSEKAETKILNLLSDLEVLKVDLSCIDDSPDLNKYGLSIPTYTIELEEGDIFKKILFGKEEKDKIYVKTNEFSSVYLVSNEIVKNIEKIIKK